MGSISSAVRGTPILLLLAAGPAQAPSNLDDQVQAFLENRRATWRDLNVPEVDGRTLRDLILKHK